MIVRVAFGCGCFAFAAVSSAVDLGPRSVLVLVLPRGGGFVCLESWRPYGVGFGPSRVLLVLFLRVWRWFWAFAFGVGLRFPLRVWCWVRSFFVCDGFVSFVPWFGASCWMAQS